MKAYLINLDRAKDRRDHMIAELSRLAPDLVVERAMAVDIKSPDWTPPDEFEPGHWRSDRWSLGPSDIEIFRSHKDAWQKIAQSGEAGIILEDDLLFSAQFGAALAQLKAGAVEGIIRFDGTGLETLMMAPEHDLSGFHLCRLKSLVASAAGYMLDPRSAAKLVRDARIERTLDDYLFDPTPTERGARGHDIAVFQLEPVVAVQAQFGVYSDPTRTVPDFLSVTKRVDAKKRRDRKYVGPILYRLRKEFLRMIHRKRQKRRATQVMASGGRMGAPQIANDLRWL